MNKTPNLNNFDDITDRYLRAYNRVVVSTNLHVEGKADQALAYLEQFNDLDKASIAIVIQDIKQRGLDEVKKTLRAITSTDEGYDEAAATA